MITDVKKLIKKSLEYYKVDNSKNKLMIPFYCIKTSVYLGFEKGRVYYTHNGTLKAGKNISYTTFDEHEFLNMFVPLRGNFIKMPRGNVQLSYKGDLLNIIILGKRVQ